MVYGSHVRNWDHCSQSWRGGCLGLGGVKAQAALSRPSLHPAGCELDVSGAEPQLQGRAGRTAWQGLPCQLGATDSEAEACWDEMDGGGGEGAQGGAP